MVGCHVFSRKCAKVLRMPPDFGQQTSFWRSREYDSSPVSTAALARGMLWKIRQVLRMRARVMFLPLGPAQVGAPTF